MYANGISVAGTTAILDVSGRGVLVGSTTGNGGRFDMVEVTRENDIGDAYEIEPVGERTMGQAEIDFKVTTYNALGRRRISVSGGYETPASMAYGDKFGTVKQVVGIDPQDATRAIIAWQDSLGLILWQRVPKVQVPEPEYVYEWNPRSNKAERAKSPGVGWSSQPVTTINIDGVAVLVGITAFGALAGVAARSVSVPTNCMYFPAGAC
jgi:hypothetical protein